MASSDVEIVNLALVKVGEDPITDFSEDRKAARVGNRVYAQARDEMLSAYRWTFAIKRRELAADGTAPAFGFSYRFLLPSDHLTFVGVYDENELQQNYTATQIPHKLEDRYVLADETPLDVFYVARITTVSQFHPLFVDALACYMAYKYFAYDFSASQSRTDQLRRDFDDIIRKAKFVNAIQGTPELIESSDWVDSRQERATLRTRIGPVQ